jgi:acyl carrier protein
MIQFVEPRVRGVVAEHLGVDGEQLTVNVSLVDELAADSLDIVELALALESRFAIVLPESLLEGVRTYGDLVDLVHAQVRDRRDAEERAELDATPALVWARIVPPRGAARHGELQRTGPLTPYAAETIAEDALSAGPGSRLELSVLPTSSDARVAFVTNEFAWLAERGVHVSVRRDPHRGALGQRPHAA